MKNIFKCLFFTLLVIKISNAMASNYVYTINSHNNQKIISICKTSIATGNLIQPCKEIDPIHYDMPDSIEQIAISPNGNKAYITTSNRVYACRINNATGYFEDCPEHHEFPSSAGNTIRDIAVDATDDYFYVLFMDIDKKSSTYLENQISMCSSKTFKCFGMSDWNGNYKNIEHLKISPDNKYAYLIDNDPSEPKLYICSLYRGIFYKSRCHFTKLDLWRKFSHVYGIRDIAVAKNNSAIYFVVNGIFGDRSNIIYCPLENSGASLGENCENSIVQPADIHNSMPPNFQPFKITLDSTGKYAYFLYTNLYVVPDSRFTSIYSCRIVDSNLQNCEKTMIGIGSSAIAFRRNSPDNEVTFHFQVH